MSIDFSPTRWDEVRGTLDAWWNHELARPVLQLIGPAREPERDKPALSGHHFIPNFGHVDAADIVDVWDYNLSTQTFLADGFPHVWANYGPGILAALIGGELETTEETVWFKPGKEMPSNPSQLHLDRFDPSCYWFKHIETVIEAGLDRWNGSVQIGMTDLGGNLDVVSTFRPSENLLLDLYDCPEEVKRLTWEAHDSWWKAYNRFNELMQPVNPGYSAWPGFFCSEPQYMLQCDFCYMIGPDMFDEFVKPELVESCRKLTHSFYHLDGPGQLAHLDSLLTIEDLDGVQWVPGAGSSDQTQWPEVYRKIRAAGKLIQLFGDLTTIDAVAEQLGSAEGIILVGGGENITDLELADFKRKWE